MKSISRFWLLVAGAKFILTIDGKVFGPFSLISKLFKES